jgi:hypothetical protein
MASRHLYDSVGLVLLWGGCGCGLLAPGAFAGDKIDFSTPAISWSVPQREAEQRDNKPAPSPTHLPTYDRSEFVSIYQETTVITPRSREMDKHAWDAHPWDSRLSLMPDADKKKLSVFERFLQSEADSSETTNSNSTGSARNERDFGSSNSNNSRSKKTDEKSSGSDDVNFRSEASTLYGTREAERKEEHFGDRFADSLGSVPWMKGLEDKEAAEQDQTRHLELERMHRGDFVQFSGDDRNSSAFSGASGPGDSMNSDGDPLASVPSAPSAPEYSTLPGSPPDGGGEAFGGHGIMGAWEPAASSEPAAFSSPGADQPWSPGTQSSGPPAVLAFPHRPGSPFQ